MKIRPYTSREFDSSLTFVTVYRLMFVTLSL